MTPGKESTKDQKELLHMELEIPRTSRLNAILDSRCLLKRFPKDGAAYHTA